MAVVNNDSFYQTSENLETFALLWLDASVNSSEENRYAQQQLRSTINYLRTFENINQCQQYIESVSSYDRLVLIVSGRLGEKIVPYIHHIRQLSSIYVYCMDKYKNEKWAKNFYKIKTVTTELNELIYRIQYDQRNLVKIEDPFIINVFTVSNENDQTTTTGMNGQFLHSLLLIDVLLRIKSIKTDKQELITLCKNEYQGNQTELNIVNEFELQYTSKNCLWWYTRESFLYKMLNKALRKQNINILFLFRFLIRDIYKELKYNQCQYSICVYRGQRLSNDELNNLQKLIGEYISINSFFSTTPNIENALEFLNQSKNSDDLNKILFIINADPSVVKTKPFADISLHSYYPNESEILFMIGSIFHLLNIYKNDQNIWIIQLILCEDDEHNLKNLFQYLKHSYADGDNEATLYSFGCVLHKMGKYDQAEICFHRSLNEISLNDTSISRLYYALGLVKMDKGDYDSSLIWLNKSLEIKLKTNISDIQNISGIYNAIGNVYRMKSNYSLALEWYNKGIELILKENIDDCKSSAHLYNNIAVIYQEEKKYIQALIYYEKSLILREKHLPLNHPDIGLSHNNIGNIYHCLNNYELALKHLNQSIKIKLESLPSHHPQIGKSYKNIGLVYEDIGDLQKALTYFKKASKIYKHSLSNDHSDILSLNTHIQRVTSKLSSN